jgi:hypothetical protein
MQGRSRPPRPGGTRRPGREGVSTVSPTSPGSRKHPYGTKLALPAASRSQLADPGDRAQALVAGLVQSAQAR